VGKAVRSLLWGLVVAVWALPVPPAASQRVQLVRVGLLAGRPEVVLSADVPLRVWDVQADRQEQLSTGAWTFRAGPRGVEIPGVARYGPVVRVSAEGDRPVRVEDKLRAYRGVVELRRTEAGLAVVNEVDLEAYLYGVLKLEINPAWPAEAVKAQAVAARTLAVASLGRFAREGYDVRDTTDSQLYGGVTFEDPRATAAVDATRGLVLLHGGQPILAVYHADSGGRTESSEYVWGRAYPYLRGVEDPYVVGSPYERWTLSLPLGQLEDLLRRAGLPVREVRAVEVAEASESGRALRVRFSGPEGAWELAGPRLRALLGPDVLRSTLFTVRVEGAAVVFEGRGWGHGVGMSQWGARGMALRGLDFVRILQHYYTGVEVAARP
jgi:stage II sporulation protein D